MKRHVLLLFLLFILPCSGQEPERSNSERSAYGIFDVTADWGTEESPPALGMFKVPGRVEVSKVSFKERIDSIPGTEAQSIGIKSIHQYTFNLVFFSTVPLVMFVLYLSIFLFNPRYRENLYYTNFLFFSCLLNWIDLYRPFSTHHLLMEEYGRLFLIANSAATASMLLFFYSLVYRQIPSRFWIFLSGCVLCGSINWLSNHFLPIGIVILFSGIVFIECLRTIYLAYRKQNPGIWIVAFGAIVYLVVMVLFILQQLWIIPPIMGSHSRHWAMLVFIFSMSVHLAYRFATTNQELEALNVELEDRVEQRTAELKSAQNQLVQSEKMASLGQLVAGIAHEINNPVNYIRSNIQPLKEYLAGYLNLAETVHRKKGSLPDELRESIETIYEENDLDYANEDIGKLVQSFEEGSNRITAIVSDLRKYTRGDREQFEPYHLHDAIDSTLTLLENRYKYHVTVHKDYGDIPEILCSPGRINQVIMNLLCNAEDAIEDKGNVWITTREENELAAVEIRDDGPGIPPDVKSKIFDPFFSTKPIGEGTGLGLSIAYGIVEQHHGTISVESEAGKGTTFTLKLPLSYDESTSGDNT